MANSKQARKRARQAEERRQHNASQRSMVRTYIKRVIKAIQTGDHGKAMEEFRDAARANGFDLDGLIIVDQDRNE